MNDSPIATHFVSRIRPHQRLGLSIGFLFLLAGNGFAQPPVIRIDTGDADAALAFLAGGEDVSRIWGTEGYIRLKKREAEMGRSFSENEFEQFLDSDVLRRRKEALQSTLNRWKQADIKAITERVRSYLPSNARLRATAYIVIKPRSNSFVYELATNPAVFLYLDPGITKE